MSRRRALLIGVEHYPPADYRELPCAPADLDRMDTALAANGYTVDRCPGTGRDAIQDAIDDACRAAEAGDTLVIYFTGHGQSLGNRPFLVPGNVRGRSAADRFIDADLSRYTKDSAAALVVLLVDACRDPADHKGMAGWGAPPAPGQGPVCVTLFGCEHNQTCQYAGEPPESLFTAALAEALAPEDKARTIAEVIASAQRRLDGLTTQHGKSAQVITPWGDRALDHVICDGPAERALRELEDPWLVAALRSPLWDRVGDADAVEETRRALQPSIEACRAVYEVYGAETNPKSGR